MCGGDESELGVYMVGSCVVSFPPHSYSASS
jgi:hypothetical protein